MTRIVLVLCLGLSVAVAGCDDPAGEEDAGPSADCTGAGDGTPCGDGRVCNAGDCRASRCGDGIVDSASGEECDDGNEVFADGCESDCRFTCSDDSRCDDGNVCNGIEQCTEHRCVAGTPAADGSGCTLAGDDPDGVCRAGSCVAAGCGNGVVDSGEECDDGNTDDDDGCRTNCTFTCSEDLHCQDETLCNGVETCDLETHTCRAGTPVACDDGDACTDDVCEPETGDCRHPLIDADGDGYAARELGACGTDCDDTRADVCPSCPELCGDIDHDCDGNPEPPGLPYYYQDCDGDGFARENAPFMQYCDPTGTGAPPAPSGSCGWTTRAPTNAANRDCDDGDADAFPGQTRWFTSSRAGGGYDFNCDGTAERRRTTAGISTSASCRFANCPPGVFCPLCDGPSGWTGTAPACGASGQYTSCSYSFSGTVGSCRRQTEAQTQSCR